MDRIERIVASLLDPVAYPHPVREPIHHIQTHISHVFLTGEFAYKIKKPVNLGFLDYSTLERRKSFCEREIELNRAFAPHLYLDVAPIYAAGDRFGLIDAEGSGVAVEYAVRMRQFEESDVLLKVFERGELRQDEVIEIAHRLAAVHESADTSAQIAAFGGPERVWSIARGNLERVKPYIGSTIDAGTFSAIESRAREFVSRHAGQLSGRVSSGRIRACHGDLHLNNICRFEGEIQFFDRIEFNDDFKNIDVVYDLAFLVMDLQFRGRRDLAAMLVNGYLESTGDYEGALLMPFYVGMRALIRGLVQSILSTETEVGLAEREGASAEASRYFDHACNALRPAGSRLVLMCGVSGSGKSQIAGEIAAKVEAVHIRSDAVRKHLAGVGLLARGAPLYANDQTEKTYEELARVGVALAQEGTPVILDATYLSRDRRSSVIARAKAAGIPSSIVYCSAPVEELRKRIQSRTGDPSDASEEVMEKQLDAAEMPDAAEADGLVTVDTSDAALIRAAIARVSEFVRA